MERSSGVEEALRRFYAALSAGDAETLVQLVSTQLVRRWRCPTARPSGRDAPV